MIRKVIELILFLLFVVQLFLGILFCLHVLTMDKASIELLLIAGVWTIINIHIIFRGASS